jgi:hypothetical protein
VKLELRLTTLEKQEAQPVRRSSRLDMGIIDDHHVVDAAITEVLAMTQGTFRVAQRFGRLTSANASLLRYPSRRRRWNYRLYSCAVNPCEYLDPERRLHQRGVSS